MANIEIPLEQLRNKIKLDEATIEKINTFGTPAVLKENSLQLEVYPNRPDLLSAQGFIRAMRNFLGTEKGIAKYKVNSPERNYKVKIDTSVKDVRPFTACAIVKGVSLDDARIKEIIDLQEKLHSTLGRNRKRFAIGIYPLDKISLPIKYEARRPADIIFIPLEENREMNGLQVLQRHPTGRKYAYLLENAKKFPVFVDSKGKVLSMPPIINSNETGKVDVSTKDLFVECSGFDFDILKKTLNIVVTTLADMGGKIYAMDLDYDKKEVTPDLSMEKVKLDVENANRILGLSLKEADIEKLLRKMGIEYKNKIALIPAWRTDIMHEVDIIEDIAIAYGYNNFVPEIPQISTIGSQEYKTTLKAKISELLIGLGLLETSSYHLIKKEEIKGLSKNQMIEVLDSKTDFKFLRPNLFVPSMRILSENKDNEYPQRMFEMGTVFKINKSVENGIEEQTNLSITLTPGNFTEIKRCLDYLVKNIELSYELVEKKDERFIEGRTAEIIINKKAVGIMGELHPNIINNWGLRLPVSFLEIDMKEIISLLSQNSS